jgi:hypothetical protein
MSITDIRLTLMPFPQRWDGAEIDLRILVAPRGDPTQPLTAGAPAFAAAKLALTAQLIPGLAQLPSPANVSASVDLAIAPPANAATLFNRVKTTVNFDPAPPPVVPPASTTSFLKQLMPSYQAAFPFERPRTPFAFTDDRFACALRGAVGGNAGPTPPVKTSTTWGRVFSTLLRQPLAAQAFGLLYVVKLAPPDPAFFAQGGWIYVVLSPVSDYAAQEIATPDLVKSYAARIPQLTPPRPLFAPVLFPVRSAPGPGNYDEIFREVEQYDDGFAKIVHTLQAARHDIHDLANSGSDALRPVEDTGIRLGWDDEQVVIWMNRQLSDDPRNSPTGRDTPLGVRSYRVDVRAAGSADPWNSLVHVKGDLKYGAIDLGQFDGELGVDVTPVQLLGNKDGDYWLPSYFTKWTGVSLVLRDPALNQLADTPPDNVSPLTAVDDDKVPLLYGNDYEFRVRLLDSSGGGPGATDNPVNPAVAGAGRCNFRRMVPPRICSIAATALSADGRKANYAVSRPLLGYPGLVYTGFPNAFAQLLADVPSAKTDKRIVGLPDPDVTILRIDVAVGSLEFDPANQFERGVPVVPLYTTSRPFPADPTQPVALEFDFQDAPEISAFPAPAAAGPLLLPSSRDVYVTFTPVCRMDPVTLASGAPDPALEPVLDPQQLDPLDPMLGYFGYQGTRVGPSSTLKLRSEAVDETGLLADVPGLALQGIILQPDPAPDAYLLAARAAAGLQGVASTDLIQRLAGAIELASDGLTYKGGPGRRLAFGCAAAMRNTLAPDRSSIAFSSKADLTGHWVVVLELLLERDWTWDGLADSGFEIARTIAGNRVVVGYVNLPRAVSALAVRSDGQVDRSGSTLVFFDAIDPKPAAGAFPSEIQATYEVTPRFRQAPAKSDPVWKKDITLPIAARPAQTPSLVSAGMALTPYQHDDGYTLTSRRQRMLWLEFSEPVLDPDDAYFGRVLAHSVDPMLTRIPPVAPPAPDEPPLPIDPELIRIITPGQADDGAGLDAMQQLVQSDSNTKFGLPLPPSLTDADPELFGFFVYEFRVGHAKGWSTAQGRFGLPLRVTGIQHPAPPLPCQAMRTPAQIVVNAPFAVPVANGKNYWTDPPSTQIWVLLYAQVTQVDGAEQRNILLTRSRANVNDKQFRGRSGTSTYGHAVWDQSDIAARLSVLGLPAESGLSVLAVELLPESSMIFRDPLGADLGEVRILRTSPLTPVPTVCVDAKYSL